MILRNSYLIRFRRDPKVQVTTAERSLEYTVKLGKPFVQYFIFWRYVIIGSRTVLKTVGRDERLGGSSPSASAKNSTVMVKVTSIYQLIWQSAKLVILMQLVRSQHKLFQSFPVFFEFYLIWPGGEIKEFSCHHLSLLSKQSRCTDTSKVYTLI